MDTNAGSLLAATAITLTSYIILQQVFKCREAFKFWETRGLKTPKPMLFLGNLIDMFLGDKIKLDREWRKEFGQNYGVYAGLSPRLIIGDPELVQQICIKDFDAFPNNDLESETNKIFGQSLICLKDDHWRRVRALMSPTFTTGKMRRMFKSQNECANELLRHLDSCIDIDGKDCIINGKDVACLYTIDTICTCCYGLKVISKGSRNIKEAAGRDEIIRAGLQAFSFSVFGLICKMTLPAFICRLFHLEPNPESNHIPITNFIRKVVENRRNMAPEARPKDYLQSLIDAKLDLLSESDKETFDTFNSDNNVDFGSKLAHEVSKKYANSSDIKLTDQEMYSQAVLLLLAGLETTSTLIANCLHVLAHHKDSVQRQLRDELKKIRISKDTIDNDDGHRSDANEFEYDSLMSCAYLDGFIQETLRFYTIAPDLSRKSNREYYFEKLGFSIPKGTIVDIAASEMMHDPQYWPEPEKFRPERFMEGENHLIVPGSYMPFGLGPRQCLGMRFALTETKLIMAKLLMRFEFEPATNSRFPGEIGRTIFYYLKDPSVKISKLEA